MTFADTPKLIGLGGMRCGSTSIHRYLTQHPGFVAPQCPDNKEVHRFDAYSFNQEQYETSAWPYVRKGQVITENTPEYLTCPHTPELIAASPVMQNAKFYVMLRNPARRAYSHWKKRVETGEESLSFDPALAAEPGRIDHNLQYMRETPGDLYNHMPFTYGYKYQSDYPLHIARWFMKIHRSRIMVIKSEKFFNDPYTVLDDLCKWVGLEPLQFWNVEETHNYTQPTANPDGTYGLNPVTLEMLRLHFKPQVEALGHILGTGYEFDLWREILEV